ncbi:hypothetical protein HA466_0197680 [Hirschfeldia incana]|nr:hypothetical protein HA466_0197680 [Hirschfeldia incana]
MAKSMCIVSLLMIFLLISTGIPKGKAQCMGTPSKAAPPGTCNAPASLPEGLGASVYAPINVCNMLCTSVEKHVRGECDDTSNVCKCYDCSA